MPRGVGHDEGPPRRREVPVGHVDGDALLALCGQAVDEEGEVDGRPLCPKALRIAFGGVELVLRDCSGVVQEPADQRRLAIVDGAAGDEPQEAHGGRGGGGDGRVLRGEGKSGAHQK